MCFGIESKREYRQKINLEERILIQSIKDYYPPIFWTGIMTSADKIGLLKFSSNVFKGTSNCQRYNQNVLTYNLEISEQPSALVKLLIDNITSENKIQQRLKALVIIKHPKTIDEFEKAF